MNLTSKVRNEVCINPNDEYEINKIFNEDTYNKYLQLFNCDTLDFAAQIANVSGKLGIDATEKWPDEGFERGWPKLLRMPDVVTERIDELWPKLGL